MAVEATNQTYHGPGGDMHRNSHAKQYPNVGMMGSIGCSHPGVIPQAKPRTVAQKKTPISRTSCRRVVGQAPKCVEDNVKQISVNMCYYLLSLLYIIVHICRYVCLNMCSYFASVSVCVSICVHLVDMCKYV